jgi:hypothetical protein
LKELFPDTPHGIVPTDILEDVGFPKVSEATDKLLSEARGPGYTADDLVYWSFDLFCRLTDRRMSHTTEGGRRISGHNNPIDTANANDQAQGLVPEDTACFKVRIGLINGPDEILKR